MFEKAVEGNAVTLKTSVYFFFLYLTSLLSSANTIENANININLSSLNTSNNVFKAYDVLHGSAEITIEDIPIFDFGYLIVQVHSFNRNIVLSNTSDQTPDTYVNGTNVGLVDMLNLSSTSIYYLYGDPNVNTTILIVVIGYNGKDPIPGGCNLTYDIEVAPFQKVTTIDYLIRVDAQPPSLQNNFCLKEISVEMYHMYLEEWDFSPDAYFKGIESMLSVKDIIKNGKKISKPIGIANLRRYYTAYRGTRSVFAIVTYFRGFESAYVPAVSYGCDIGKESEDCYEPVAVFWKVVYGLMVFFGLFMCLQGHRFFQVSLFFTGFFVAAVFTYVILAHLNLTEEESIVSLSVIGVIYGLFWVTMWWKFGIPILSVTLSFIVAGYLAASIFFYVGLADVPIFQNDINYWSVLIGITLLVTLAFLILSHLHSNIVATSFIGAYVLIVPFDHYIGGNIRYIFLNTLHRATVPYFNLAVISPPIQTNDQNLFISWALVTLIGVYTQWRQNKGRAPFPPPPTTPRYVSTENTPLLGARHA